MGSISKYALKSGFKYEFITPPLQSDFKFAYFLFSPPGPSRRSGLTGFWLFALHWLFPAFFSALLFLFLLSSFIKSPLFIILDLFLEIIQKASTFKKKYFLGAYL
jgi:hypothetical protein